MVFESIKSALDTGGAGNTYQCIDCDAEFESAEVKEDARCPHCGGLPSPE